LRKWTKQYCWEQWRHNAHLAVEHVRSSQGVDDKLVDSVATGDVLFDDIFLSRENQVFGKDNKIVSMHVLTADRTKR
jgi:hypothetical protein